MSDSDVQRDLTENAHIGQCLLTILDIVHIFKIYMDYMNAIFK